MIAVFLFIFSTGIDAIVNYKSVNYTIYFFKYFIITVYYLLILHSNNYDVIENALYIITKIYIILGIFALILFLLSIFSFSIPEGDVSGFKKQDEERYGLYYFPASIGLILVGDTQSLFGFFFPRFSGFHIEPASFMLYFGMLLFFSWRYLNKYYRIGAIILIFWAHSFTALATLAMCLLLSVIFLSNNKWKSFLILIPSILVILFVFIPSSIDSNQISILSKLGSSSNKITLGFYEVGTSLIGRGFNVKPGVVDINQNINIISLFVWSVYILFMSYIFIKNRRDKDYYFLLFFLLMALKSPYHTYPIFLPLILLMALYSKIELGMSKKHSLSI